MCGIVVSQDSEEHAKDQHQMQADAEFGLRCALKQAHHEA